jgi:Tol biopolymer transport system component
MKNVFLTLALCASLSGMAQLVNVGSIEKVNIPANEVNKIAAISPAGDYVLVTTDYNKGLTKYDLATEQTQVITNANGAGYDAKVSQDGQNVVYREKSMNEKHLTKTAVFSKNIASGQAKQLMKPTRDLNGVAIEGNTAIAVNKSKMEKKALSAEKAQQTMPVLSLDRYQLMITMNGKTRQLSPLGTQYRYIWPSMSPDGTKVLFFVSGMGAYVCNTDGSDVQPLCIVRAPKWYDNNIIVGMNDKDNGEVYTSSEIIAVDLQGHRQVLTGSDVIAMYPLPSAQSGKIAFSTPTGEAYIINLVK